MKIKNKIFILCVMICSLDVSAAVVLLKNSSPNEVYDVQVMESRADEYRPVGEFNKYSLAPNSSPIQHNSYLKEIMGFRWREKIKFIVDAPIIVCVEYMLAFEEPISRFSLNGYFEIFKDGFARYYFNKNNKNDFKQGPIVKRVYGWVMKDGAYVFENYVAENYNTSMYEQDFYLVN